MIEDILASVADLFDGDVTLMIAAALLLLGSAIAFLVMRIKNVRDDVQRRVAGGEEEAPKAATPKSNAVKGMIGSAVGALADSVGQTDHGQTRVLRSKLIQAGYNDKQALVWFFGLRILGTILGAGMALLATRYLSPDSGNSALAMHTLIGCAVGFVAPSLMLDKRINKLKQEHTAGFPDFMDLMVVCAQAGLSMEAAINRIAAEISIAFPSLARNLDMAARELRSGKPLAKCIESLAVRLGIPEASSFSTLLQQSEELGSSLTQSLRTYSDDMRNKRLMKAEEKAYSLPAKLVVPLTLFVFPVLLVVLMLPIVVSVSESGL